jgi:hypothetical protein
MRPEESPLGADLRTDGECGFLVWVPRAGQVQVDLQGEARAAWLRCAWRARGSARRSP